ncbi:unnamed protein product, partial [Mesorhabditis belari]|uniref:GH18 domain-containing protein n=1 Tax=Mesorhabditis belari TaxID=2138241 RepID=A0AAF3J3R6_9BILA
MGLVLWEMIERRQIFSNYPGGYDYANTTENELCKVERFECIEEFALIIKKCTKFNLTFRPKASEVLLELEVLEKSYGKLDFRLTPEMDLTQTRLLKPIGFNGCVEAKISEEEFADDKLSGVFSARLSSINDWVIAGSSEGKDIESVKTASSSSFPYIRGAYFTNWSQYRDGRAKFTLDDYLPGLCTHIFYAFAVFGNDFKLKETEPNDLNSPDGSLGQYTLMAKLKEKQAGLKVLLSIGGANFGTKLFEEMSSTRENRKIFIDSAISWVRRHSFDGIDISWLYPREQNCFADLLMELREEIDVEAQQNGANAKLILSAAVSPIRHRMAAYNIHNMSKCLDFVNLLTFHYWHSGCIETTGMNSPLYDRRGLNSDQAEWNINWAAHEWYRRGFPKEKIVIGDPTKTLPGSFDNKATPPQPHSKINGFIAYHELCDLLEKGGEKNWHDEHKVPWFVENGRWWSYESQESIKIKMDFIKTKQFGGAVAWCLDFDDFNGQSNFHQGEKFPLLSTMSRELSD